MQLLDEQHPESITQGNLIGLVDAACAKDLNERQPATGQVSTHSGVMTMHESETQSLTALSSTEAEFIATVTAAKTAKLISLVLLELGFEQTEPTPMSEDNEPTTDIAASQKPTEHTQHIDLQFFAIQEWAHDKKDVSLSHTHDVLNLSDDLTKLPGRALCEQHARRVMGHCNVAKI